MAYDYIIIILTCGKIAKCYAKSIAGINCFSECCVLLSDYRSNFNQKGLKGILIHTEIEPVWEILKISSFNYKKPVF